MSIAGHGRRRGAVVFSAVIIAGMKPKKNLTPSSVSEFSDTALMVEWEDGHASIFAYEDLRLACPCAACRRIRGKSRTGKIPVKPDGGIRPANMERVGHYAVRFKWSDGHDTGIYTFEFLRENCPCEECANASA